MMKKMKKRNRVLTAGIIILAVVMGMTSCMSACKSSTILSGPTVSEDRHLNGFEEIEINGSPRVCYVQADSFSVRVEGPQEAVEDILTEVHDKTLAIRNRGKINLVNISYGNDDELVVYVASPDLTGIRLNGSGDFEAKGRIDSDRMDVTLRGSGDIEIKDIICDRCELQLIGSGDVSIGNLDAIAVAATLVGSGDVSLGLTNVKDTQLSLKGSGDIDANFKEGCGSVDCELRGSGDISLNGAVKKFTQQKSGSGEIEYHRLTVK